MKVAAVIPARLQSARLPRKPLLAIAGTPMILRVLERARACPGLDRIIVATDSEEIQNLVERGGGEVRMTSPDHRMGSDRVAEVAQSLDEEIILNLQGDEPLLPPSTIQTLLDFAESHSEWVMITARVALHTEEDVVNPNIVKVVTALDGRALYFSRYPIPYRKADPLWLSPAAGTGRRPEGYFKHVGIYLYRREFLLRFVKMPSTRLEISESLEQLRILENGYPVYVVEVPEDSISVDTAEDRDLVESLILSGARH